MKTVLGVQVPEMADFGTIPADLERMVTDLVGKMAQVATDALAPVKGAGWTDGKTIMDLYTRVPTGKVKWDYASVAIVGTEGEGVLIHQAGFVPTHVVLTPRSSSRAVALTVDTTGATTQNVRIRAYNVDTGAPLANGSTVGVYYTVRA